MVPAGIPDGMTVVLHPSLPFAPWADPRCRRLPGVMPLAMDDWLQVDAAYGGQMALRDRLIAERPDEVHALWPDAVPAASELLQGVLGRLPGLGFGAADGQWLRPDGARVTVDAARPLMTLGRLLQNDFCILQNDGSGEHRLTGAILCFPAGWLLHQKLGMPLARMHAPISRYSDDTARRVQRLMDAVRPEAPLWRANAHRSRSPLFNPLPEGHPHDKAHLPMLYVRSERQCLIRLPLTRAVVFTIHTYLVRLEDLTSEQAAALAAHPVHSSP